MTNYVNNEAMRALLTGIEIPSHMAEYRSDHIDRFERIKATGDIDALFVVYEPDEVRQPQACRAAVSMLSSSVAMEPPAANTAGRALVTAISDAGANLPTAGLRALTGGQLRAPPRF